MQASKIFKKTLMLSILFSFLFSCSSNVKKDKKIPDHTIIVNEKEAIEVEEIEEVVEEEVVEEEVIEVEVIEVEVIEIEKIEKVVEEEVAVEELVEIIKAQPKPQHNKVKNIIGKINFTNQNTNAELENTIIYFKPDELEYEQQAGKIFEISTQNKRFKPSVLAIPVGSEVKFPNMDRIIHNVFSVSKENSFDLGLYSAGTVKSVIFDKPGIIYVHCNVHHSMQADILVLDTPWYTTVNEDGSYLLNNLPKVDGTLFSWHPRSKLNTYKVSKSVEKFNVSIEITRKKIPKHLNKFGKSYRPVKEK